LVFRQLRHYRAWARQMENCNQPSQHPIWGALPRPGQGNRHRKQRYPAQQKLEDNEVYDRLRNYMNAYPTHQQGAERYKAAV